MKKSIPYIAPIAAGLFGGWFLEAMLRFFSIAVSPFAGADERGFLTFCGGTALLSALILIAAVAADVLVLLDPENGKRVRSVLLWQAVVAAILCVLSLRGAEPAFRALSHLF